MQFLDSHICVSTDDGCFFSPGNFQIPLYKKQHCGNLQQQLRHFLEAFCWWEWGNFKYYSPKIKIPDFNKKYRH